MNKQLSNTAIPATTEYLGLRVTVKRGKGGPPPVLVHLMEKLEMFISKPKRYPNLYEHKIPNIQRRKSIVLVLRSLLLRCDLVSLRIGFPSDSGFIDTNIQRIIDDTGLDQRNISRVLKHLDDVNLVSRERKWIKKNIGISYSGRPSKRYINPFLFSMFGLQGELKEQQVKKLELDRQKYKFVDEQGRHAISTLMKQINHKISGKQKSKSPINVNNTNDTRNELAKKPTVGSKASEHRQRIYTELSTTFYSELRNQGKSSDEIKTHINALVDAIINKGKRN
jgi:hypothetical protein